MTLELFTAIAAAIAATTGAFLTLAVARNMAADRAQRRALANMDAPALANGRPVPTTRRERRALARAAARQERAEHLDRA